MPRTRKHLLAAIVAGALLLTGAAGGGAVATGKIKGKQIAKNAISTKHLRAGAVTGDKIAPSTVTGDKIAPGTVTGANIAPGSISGAQVDEASLGRVPDAAAIAGATVTPISLVMPNTHPSQVTVASGPGWVLRVACSGAFLQVELSKTGSSALVTGQDTSVSGQTFTIVAPGNFQQSVATTYADWRLVSITAGTATTTVQLTAVFAAGQFTSQTDCFFNGTVTTTP